MLAVRLATFLSLLGNASGVFSPLASRSRGRAVASILPGQPTEGPASRRSNEVAASPEDVGNLAAMQMRKDVESGLSWYCQNNGKGGNSTVCKDKPPKFETFQMAEPKDQRNFLLQACMTRDSPMSSTVLCNAFRSNLRRDTKEKVLEGYKRLGRFLVFEWPLYKAVAKMAGKVVLKVLGMTKRVAVVPLQGMVASGAGIDVSSGDAVEAAFKSAPACVVLEINSGGGSPVQSSLLYQRLVQLRKRYPKIPLVACVEDICASGAYFIAAACSEILVDPSSIVGSIGVVRADFGFSKVLKKYGVERRVLTAGPNKVYKKYTRVLTGGPNKVNIKYTRVLTGGPNKVNIKYTRVLTGGPNKVNIKYTRVLTGGPNKVNIKYTRVLTGGPNKVNKKYALARSSRPYTRTKESTLQVTFFFVFLVTPPPPYSSSSG